MGIAFGILMQKTGYHFLWSLLMSLIIFSGTMQFVTISFLSGGFGLLQIIFMTFALNFRYMFYGLSCLDRFKGMGWKKPYLIHGLTDETYSVICTGQRPEGVGEKEFIFYVTLFDHIYWIIGCVLGGLLGEVLQFNTTGIDFAMTALFVVVCVEQWQNAKERRPAVLGGVSAVLCLILFGADNMVLPAMLLLLGGLLLFRKSIEPNLFDEIHEENEMNKEVEEK